MVDHCPICQRTKEPTDKFCTLHLSALHNLEHAYPQWNKALGGNLTQTDYYKKLVRLSETGTAAKTLIKYILGNPEAS
jgi:hypothetical protein